MPVRKAQVKKRIGHDASDIKVRSSNEGHSTSVSVLLLRLSTLGPDPSFSPTTAAAGSVQVERGRWESTNEWKAAGRSSLPHFAAGRTEN